MSVKVDSRAFAAGKGLTEALKPIKEVLEDTENGEIKWGFYELNESLHEGYGVDGSPRQVQGLLQRQVELNMRDRL